MKVYRAWWGYQYPRYMDQWVIYDHPRDYPNSVVARLWNISSSDHRPTTTVIVGPTIERVRAALPSGLITMGRMPMDDPKIMEVWF